MSLYRYFRWLSLDIILGALIFLRFLADFYELYFPISVYITLGVAIWLIYTTDHIVDARAARKPDLRRRFHLTHQNTLIFFSGLLAVVGLISVYFLPIEVIRWGALLSAFCVAYVITIYFLPGLWYKEIVVAVGYAAGIFLAPFALKGSFVMMDMVLFTQLVAIAAINLLIFSYYDRDMDRESGFGSIVLKLGSRSAQLINLLIVLLFTSTLFFLVHEPSYQSMQLVYLLMSVTFYLIIRLKQFFGQVERFRVFGDAVFFMPVIFLI